MVEDTEHTIQSVFSGFLRAAADNPHLRDEVILEGILTGRYATPETEDGTFGYQGLGTIMYRAPGVEITAGDGKTTKQQHAFYFIPEGRFHRASKKTLNEVADSIARESPNGELEILSGDSWHTNWPPKSSDQLRAEYDAKTRLAKKRQTRISDDEEDYFTDPTIDSEDLPSVTYLNEVAATYGTVEEIKEAKIKEEKPAEKKPQINKVTKPKKEKIKPKQPITQPIPEPLPKLLPEPEPPQLPRERRSCTEEEIKDIERRLREKGLII